MLEGFIGLVVGVGFMGMVLVSLVRMSSIDRVVLFMGRLLVKVLAMALVVVGYLMDLLIEF